ncbi:unknown [Prevotella sp. CAG:1124]|nr:unknown [Prevotella sp. CAG:1124]
MVPVSGCFVTVSSTAGLPFSEAVPRRGTCAPTCTSATSPSVMASPPELFITAEAISATSSVDTSPRTMYSLPYS